MTFTDVASSPMISSTVSTGARFFFKTDLDGSRFTGDEIEYVGSK